MTPPEQIVEADTAFDTIDHFLIDLIECTDFDEVAADGGITVGMVFQQQAKWMRTLLARHRRQSTEALEKEVAELKRQWTEQTQRYLKLVDECEAVEAKLARAVEVLRRIERWHGEFPNVDDPPHGSCSYALACGSNGERDFMRNLASTFLASLAGEIKG